MFKQIFITREDGVKLLQSQISTMTDQQLEDALSAVFFNQQLNFRTVHEYKTVDRQTIAHFLKSNGIENVR